MNAIIKDCSFCLIHVPDLVRYGSKPYREIQKNPQLEYEIRKRLRSFGEIAVYPPNQVFIGNLKTEKLNEIPQPWYRNPAPTKTGVPPWSGQFGEILNELLFYGFLKIADSHQNDFIWLHQNFIEAIKFIFDKWPIVKAGLEKARSRTLEEIKTYIRDKQSLPLYFQNELIGCVNRDNSEDGKEDENLSALLMLENLAAKASGAAALNFLFNHDKDNDKEKIDYIISCSEEAVGDRYNRGGGNLGKAIGEIVGLKNATGPDIKAFCSAPIYAIIHAAALIKAGLHKNIVVVGGGSLAKLGMKFLHHLRQDMPILEDTLGCFAILVGEDDGCSPIVRLDAVGKHDIGAGASQQAIMESLILKPLERIGKKITDIDKYASELHNPEITVPSRSGDVPLQNYKIIAALAVQKKEITPAEIPEFINKKGMKGFAPTQGHIPAGVPYLGHAVKAIKEGKIKNAMFLARASLFLGRLSQLSDGASFLIEKNPALDEKEKPLSNHAEGECS